jgi:hypothetical protein
LGLEDEIRKFEKFDDDYENSIKKLNKLNKSLNNFEEKHNKDEYEKLIKNVVYEYKVRNTED